VLAEASKTLSLQDDGTHDAGDQLLHGEGAVKARSGIGPVLIALLSGERERGHVEVKDIRADERFKDLPGNVAEVARSLICLPLRSARGYVIGLYRVLDETPREEGFSEVEIGFLRDMAATTMDHIESSRVRQRHDRAEKMVKALAIYLEGGESLREWWLNQATEGRSIQQSSINEQNRRGFSLSQQADTELGVQDGPDGYSAANMEDLEENFDSLPITYSRSATSRSVHSSHRPGISERQSSFSTTDPVTYSSNLAFVNTGFASSENSSVTNSSALPPTLASRLADPDTQLPGKELQEALLSADVKQTFSRASNLLREAIDLDGVAFYDASVGSFGARSLQEQKAPGAHTLDSVPETTSSGSDFPNTNASKIGNGDSAVSAGLLGYSTRTRSSLRSHADSEMLGRFSEPLLKVLAKRYPHGKVFNLDDDGSISSSDVERSSISRDPSAPKSRSSSPPQEESTETKERKARKQLSRQAEAAAILEVIPGARSVAWFPLWDAASERWYAGALIWSLHATRVFTPEDELTYMAAWGNSIMAEVSRLSALVASRMKVDFVSSISHELRSPLHGILASVEFLQEEEDMPAMQADMISTIQSCGKTLLDTINHVLDFAKIIKKTSKKSPKTSQKRPSGSRRENPDNMKELSDICILAEEVVDSVYAGRRSRDNTAPRSPFPTPLLVILDISHESTWKYKVNIGAFRRVLMNLFSNALKYTEAGFVKVALSLKHEPSREGKARPILQITIIDSGKGISEEFLKDHLYTAFKQEDALSAGTGLGLSIVRQVLVDVRGAIEIESELGAGTTAAVSIPVRASSRASPDGEVHAIAEIREKMRGRRALVANEDFNVYPKMSDAPTGILSPEAQAMIYLKSSVESMLTDWFDMDMESPSGDAASPDVVVLMASDNIGEKITSLEETHSESAISNSMVVVALCDASYRCRNSTTQGGTRIFYLRLP
jgi:signal transduction histidine kinase